MAATDFDYYLTRNEIIEQAYSKVGAFAIGQTLTANMLESGVRNLNAMVQDWQNEHIFLWNIKPITLTTVAATSAYSLTSDSPILYIDRGYIEDSNGETQHKLDPITYKEYQLLLDSSDGEPSSYAYDYVEQKVYLYPEPDAVYTLKLFCACKGRDFDSASGTGDFPTKFAMALVYGLASLLADDVSIPRVERVDFAKKAEYYFQKAKKGDRERLDYTAVRGAY